ncbi:MAG: hypothetical protein IAF58_15805 [Leptolyngbya sp.]|nr:hypothetical protein [Candidatus Melainabacteria bacterium]
MKSKQAVMALLCLLLLAPAMPLNAQPPAANKAKKAEGVIEDVRKKGATVPGLVLKQQFRFVGKSTSYVSALGIRLQSLSMSMILNSKTKKISVFSDDTKKYCVYTEDGWMKRSKVLLANNSHALERTPWKLKASEKVAGYPCKVYKRTTKQSEELTLEDFLWVTTEVELPNDAKKLIFSLLKLDASVPDGVPVRHELHKITFTKSTGLHGQKKVQTVKDRDYETFSAVKEPVAGSAYIMPSGYKLAGSEMEVFFSDEQDLMDEPLDVYKPSSSRADH